MNSILFKFTFTIFLLSIVVSFSVVAQTEQTIVAVGDAQAEKEKIFFEMPTWKGEVGGKLKQDGIELIKLLRNDFAFYLHRFDVLTEGSEDPGSFLIKTSLSGLSNNFEYEVTLTKDQKVLETFKGIVRAVDLRQSGHALANRIYERITGKRSIFESFIVFVSDRPSRSLRNRIKELYMMDFDGRNVRQLTRHGGIVISPSISPDKRYILYSLISRKGGKGRNINLYVYDLKNDKSKLVSSRAGINSGAVFMPGGRSVLLTLSNSGNAEIYEMDLLTNKLKRMTKNFAQDVDPSVSADGSLMTFLSGRSGQAHIYTMNPQGVEKDLKRISFVGRFNATPRFSPAGNEIAFSSWVDNRFDIYRINARGEDLTRLTKNFGSNEDPTYSPDGQFIAFSSQRVLTKTRAIQDLYIMNREGEIVGAITKDFGNCITPRWSK